RVKTRSRPFGSDVSFHQLRTPSAPAPRSPPWPTCTSASRRDDGRNAASYNHAAELIRAMTHTYKIEARPWPSALQPQRWSYYVGNKHCGYGTSRDDALRAAREQVDEMQRDAAARRERAQSVEKPR